MGDRTTLCDKSTHIRQVLRTYADRLAVVLYDIDNGRHVIQCITTLSIGRHFVGGFMILPPDASTNFKVGDLVIVRNKKERGSFITYVYDMQMNEESVETWYDAHFVQRDGEVDTCLNKSDGSIRCFKVSNGDFHNIGKPAVVWPAGALRWFVDGMNYRSVGEYLDACGDRLSKEDKMVFALKYGDTLPKYIDDLIDDDILQLRNSMRTQ